jgi:hypothetical protein
VLAVRLLIMCGVHMCGVGCSFVDYVWCVYVRCWLFAC